ncbi:MAG: Leucine dehydrogenase [Chlamydiia bacterium]|nr:Leucine dehydrogenase [Chlamydiia bacterium]MCH9616491.1 Leucine dehydrogenase [Chlamydiia bacterium]MCH9629523.1 Leucine dehydrogenase [Chlamydiia bacterium]
MSLTLKEIVVPGYEKVLKVTDKASKLVAVIAIHNTQLGPALGGTRIFPYNTFDEALQDALRLAKGMTYKSAAANTGLGGGKSVIIADPNTEKTPEKLKAFGDAIEQLSGQYICAEDVGCTVDDANVIRTRTRYVVGTGAKQSSGDPSPFTAWGTIRGMQAALKFQTGSESFQGKTIAIQGLGNVGRHIAEFAFWQGANLIVADINEKKASEIAKRYGATVCPIDEILKAECDILAPCALGGIINSFSIPDIKAKIIAGCANNQLQDDYHADFLARRGILYVPDFILNAGGLINVTQEVSKEGYRPEKARDSVNKIYDELMTIFNLSKQNSMNPLEAAMTLVEYRLRYGVGKREELSLTHG